MLLNIDFRLFCSTFLQKQVEIRKNENKKAKNQAGKLFFAIFHQR
jgi:hypothetical protein